MLDATTVANKWAANLSGAVNQIKAGVQAVTTSPGVAAAAAIPQYLAGVNDAVSSGRMANALNSVTLSGWQQATINKGIPRISSGANAAIPKMTAFMNKWLPYEAQLQGVLAGMPRGNLQQNIARAVATINHNAAFPG